MYMRETPLSKCVSSSSQVISTHFSMMLHPIAIPAVVVLFLGALNMVQVRGYLLLPHVSFHLWASLTLFCSHPSPPFPTTREMVG